MRSMSDQFRKASHAYDHIKDATSRGFQVDLFRRKDAAIFSMKGRCRTRSFAKDQAVFDISCGLNQEILSKASPAIA